MKNKKIVMAMALSATIGLFVAAPIVCKGHGNEEKEHAKGEGKEEKMPATAGGIWHEIQEHKEELEKTIKHKKLADVHKIAFEIRDYAKALPEKSKDLAADKLKRVQSAVSQIEKLAGDLDASGDAGDQAKTEANFKKLEGVLKLIEAQYPGETLKSKQVSQYTCPMHPDVVQNKAGKCATCGMDMVEKK